MASTADPGSGRAPGRAPQPKRPTPKEKRDDSIMGTNNSCIVSKRSVEKLYHKRDDGFLRYFVNKFQRRSPLINRGYWLRMRAIEHCVRDFLKDGNTKKRKVVVNLGCGYDTMPFNFLSLEPVICEDALFIDVDYKQLIEKKCTTIRNTPQLRDVISDLAGTRTDDIPITSSRYVAIACDLEKIQKLEGILMKDLKLTDCCFLFVAEVSITYMGAGAAIELLRSTAKLDARFCVLEQFLPDGPEHPFAKTMLKHFEKLNSPLRSALRYPKLSDQEKRFQNAGWARIEARSLWQMWSEEKSNFLSPADRRALDLVEPFDEWEEFALFAGHYFLLEAWSSTSESLTQGLADVYQPAVPISSVPNKHAIHMEQYPASRGFRRFAAAFGSGQTTIHHGGHGTQGRLTDCEFYRPRDCLTVEESEEQGIISTLANRPTSKPVMCHSISTIAGNNWLLAGGRASPDTGSRQCLIFSQSADAWTETYELPYDLYRHCAVTVTLEDSARDSARIVSATNDDGTGHDPEHYVFVVGGRSGSGNIHDEWLYFNAARGWLNVEIVGDRPPARYGAAMSTSGRHKDKGFLSGGMGSDALVLQDFWSWELVQGPTPTVRCLNITDKLKSGNPRTTHALHRFGATLVPAAEGVYVVGGVAAADFLHHNDEILFINEDLEVLQVEFARSVERPLLVGCSVQPVHADKSAFTIISGGAVCFSFGTCWNQGCYTVADLSRALDISPLTLVSEAIGQTLKTKKEPQLLPVSSVNRQDGIADAETSTGQSECRLSSKGRIINAENPSDRQDIKAVIQGSLPAILRGLDTGKCTSSWTTNYLKECVGADREVVVHVAKTINMNFLEKNFEYQRTSFGEFLHQAEGGEPVYLRSLSANKPTQQATNLGDDFPSIADDFSLPPELDYIKNRVHSMPFRISGPVSMWLHYDVMANVLCQIKGHKRLILFPPSDVTRLSFPPGASSSRLNVFDTEGKTIIPPSTHAIGFDLEPGDILYIPALWPHTAYPTSGMSIAVNVFFRNLDAGYAAGKDVYGNRDVEAYENGRRDLQKIGKGFGKLPAEMRRFYMQRLASELMEMAEQ